MAQPQLPPVKVKPVANNGLSSDGKEQWGKQSAASDEQPLSPTGRFFLSDAFYTTVLCAVEFKDRMTVEELRDVLSATLLKHPRFHSRMETRGCNGSRAVWVRTDVDMTYHMVEETTSEDAVTAGTTPAENGSAATDATAARPEEGSGDNGAPSESGRLAAAAVNRCDRVGSVEWHVTRLIDAPPLDITRPLWQVHLVPVSRRNARSAAIFRIHHALGDGVSLMSLLLACARRTDDPSLLPTIPSASRTARTSSAVQARPASRGSAVADSGPGATPPDGLVASGELKTQTGDEGAGAGETGKAGGGSDKALPAASQSEGRHVPSAESSFTLDSMAAGAATAVPNGKDASASDARGSSSGLSILSLPSATWRALVVLANTLRQVSLFLAVLTWKADTATAVKATAAWQRAKAAGLTRAAQLRAQGEDEGKEGADKQQKHTEKQPLMSVSCFAISEALSLADISRVRRSFGATINDVMVAIISGGLDRYLRHHHVAAGGSGEDALKQGAAGANASASMAPRSLPPLPATVRVSAVCLVNIRPAAGLQDMAEMMAGRQSKARWGNCLGTFLLPLPVQSPSLEGGGKQRGKQGAKESADGGEEERERRRLREVMAVCACKRQSLEAHWNYLNARIVLATSGIKGASTLMHQLCAQTTISLSNMMGPVEEIALGGHPISGIFPTTVGHPHALTLHFQTYNGGAHIIMSGVKESIPDPDFLLHCCVQTLEVLKKGVA